MRIGEIANRAKVSARILRYYESQGLILSQRLANGYRDYPLQTVDIVRQIKDLIECGFSTRQIGAFYNHPEAKIPIQERAPPIWRRI